MILINKKCLKTRRQAKYYGNLHAFFLLLLLGRYLFHILDAHPFPSEEYQLIFSGKKRKVEEKKREKCWGKRKKEKKKNVNLRVKYMGRYAQKKVRTERFYTIDQLGKLGCTTENNWQEYRKPFGEYKSCITYQTHRNDIKVRICNCKNVLNASLSHVGRPLFVFKNRKQT